MLLIIIIISDIDKCDTTNTIDSYNIAQEYQITSRFVDILRGRDGRDGLQGEKGDRGLQGDKGEQGSVGAQGIKGEQGDVGRQGPPGPSGGGALYTRWGRTICPGTSGTQRVYKGLAAGTFFSQTGGGANYLCITEEPTYLSDTVPIDGVNNVALSYLYGAEYELPRFSTLYEQNVPCAVCHTSQRSSKLMLPGTIKCPQSWTEEYEGYLMSERTDHKHSTVYECVDKDGEVVPGGADNVNGALFFLVGAVCGVGLPCPPFERNRPITCVVCTK